MGRQFLVVVVAAYGLGCSEDGGGSEGAAGSGNAGGTQPSGGQATSGGGTTAGTGTAGGGSHSGGGSGGAAGGSGRATLGAASLNILAPAGCSVEAHYEDSPLVDGGHPVTATAKNKTIADGAQDTDGARARVACVWMGSAPPYDFSVGFQETGQNSRSLSLSGKAVAGETRQDYVVFGLPDDKAFAGVCTITTIAADETNHSVWGTFHCDSVTGRDGQDTCGVGDSYFYFENCSAP